MLFLIKLNALPSKSLKLPKPFSNNILISANVSRNKRKKKVDGMAAEIILQGYLDRTGKGN